MLKLIQTEPSAEPVDLAEVKSHLVIEDEDSDPMLVTMITAARRHVERRTGRALVRQKWRLYFDRFYSSMDLAPPPVKEVDQIQYVDGDGVTQTASTSLYDFDEAGQRVLLGYGQTWPSPRAQKNAVWIDVWSGYYVATASPLDLTDHVPTDLKYAILMLVEDLFEHRGKQSEVLLYENKTAEALMRPYWCPDQ